MKKYLKLISVLTVCLSVAALSSLSHAEKGKGKSGGGGGGLPPREQTRCDRFNKDPNKVIKETEWIKKWDGRSFGPPVEGNLTMSGLNGMRSFAYLVQDPPKTGAICKKNPFQCRPTYWGNTGSVLFNKFAKNHAGGGGGTKPSVSLNGLFESEHMAKGKSGGGDKGDPGGAGSGGGSGSCAMLVAAHSVDKWMIPPQKPKLAKPMILSGSLTKPDNPIEDPPEPTGPRPKVKLRSIQFDPQHKKEVDAEFTVYIRPRYFIKHSNSDEDSAILVANNDEICKALADVEETPPCDPDDKLEGTLVLDALRNGGPRVVVATPPFCLDDEFRGTVGNVPAENDAKKVRPDLKGGQSPGDSGALLRLMGSHGHCAMGNLFGGPGGPVELSPLMGFSTPLKWMNKVMGQLGMKAPKSSAPRKFTSEEELTPHNREVTRRPARNHE